MRNFLNIFKYGFANIFNTQGRVSRSVYFIYSLTINTLLIFIQLIALVLSINPYLVMIVTIIISLVLGFSILVRRIHDAGYGGKYYLLLLIPIIGVLIFFSYTLKVDKNDNSYGSFAERKVSLINKNLAIILLVILSFVNTLATIVTTGVSAKVALETALEIQGNAKSSLLGSYLDMIGRQAKVNAVMESEDGLVTVENLQQALEESSLPAGFLTGTTETGITLEIDGVIGSIDVDPGSSNGYKITY